MSTTLTTFSPACKVVQRPRIVPATRTGLPGCEAFEGGQESRSRPAGLRLLHCCDEAGTLSSNKQANTRNAKRNMIRVWKVQFFKDGSK